MSLREELAIDKLKKAMANLISSKSIHQITIKEICEQAHVNRSTFYHYFSDEYALLNALEEEAAEKLRLKLLENPIVSEESLTRYLDYIKSNIDYFEPLFFGESCVHFRNLFIEKTFNLTEAIMNSNSTDMTYLYTFISYGSLETIKEWINNGFDIKTETLSQKLFEYNKALVKIV